MKTYCGGGRLWQIGFHFADWLALDNPDKKSCFGRTDPYYVASVYYLYSALLTAKAAGVLGKTEDQAYYEKVAGGSPGSDPQGIYNCNRQSGD